jgi:hypothetical protein
MAIRSWWQPWGCWRRTLGTGDQASLLKDARAALDERFRIEEQESAVATATAGCGPERTFAITHFIEIPGDSRINARRRGVAGARADSGTAFRAGSLSPKPGEHTRLRDFRLCIFRQLRP